MGNVDALCERCHTPITWLPMTPMTCQHCHPLTEVEKAIRAAERILRGVS